MVIEKRQQLTDECYELLAGRFKVLSEPFRLKILFVLYNGELSVGEIVARVGGLQANVSKHLGMLLEAGLLVRRKEGLSAYYRVADENVFLLFNLVCDGLERKLKVRS